MSLAPVLRAASGGIPRRLVQTTVVFVVLAGSTAAALLGVTLLTSANELFYSAVAARHGADLAVTIDAARVTTAQLAATRPAGAVTGSVSWLPSARQTGAEQSVNTAFVVAFALIGLALAGLVVTNVVSGAVLAGYRRIGVLKSIGFTPAQVAACYVAQLGIPTVTGCLAGAALGNYWVLPELNNSAAAFHVAHQTVPLWINVTVPLGMCLLAALAALVPALRAGGCPRRRRWPPSCPGPATGTPRTGWPPGWRLPRPVSIGLAAPFARPARSAATLAAISFGLAAVVLAVGLYGSLDKVNGSPALGAGQVQVDPAGRQATFTASQVTAITAALRAQPGTRRYVAEADLIPFPGAPRTVTVSGLAVPVTAYDGPAGWLGWPLVSGRWFRGRGEVDVSPAFLTQSGLAVGDRITLHLGARAVPARIVGQVFSLGGPGLLTGWPTLGGAAAGLAARSTTSGSGRGPARQAYAAALTRALGRGEFAGLPPGRRARLRAGGHVLDPGAHRAAGRARRAGRAELGAAGHPGAAARPRRVPGGRDDAARRPWPWSPAGWWSRPSAPRPSRCPAGCSSRTSRSGPWPGTLACRCPARSATSTGRRNSCCWPWPGWASPRPARCCRPAGPPPPGPRPRCAPNSARGTMGR